MMTESEAEFVKIFTDGACKGNPGPGGWAWLMKFEPVGIESRDKGGEPNTTNNRMELTAAIKALEHLLGSLKIAIYTDSKYLRNGITEWIENWKKKGWRTANKKPVKNQDLWERLDALRSQHEIEWVWVKAHDGHRENELVDNLANEAIEELL